MSNSNSKGMRAWEVLRYSCLHISPPLRHEPVAVFSFNNLYHKHTFLCHKTLSFPYVIIGENVNQAVKPLCFILLVGVIPFCHVRLCYLFRLKPQPGVVYKLLGWCNGFWAQIIQKCVGIKGFASTECTWEYWPLQEHLLIHTLLPFVTIEMAFTHTDSP